MSAEQIRSPRPICEKCWLEKNSSWEPHSMDGEGNILMKLKDVDVPTKYNTGELEICVVCEKPTVAGIYELSDKGVTPPFGFGFSSFSEMHEEEHDDNDR